MRPRLWNTLAILVATCSCRRVGVGGEETSAKHDEGSGITSTSVTEDGSTGGPAMETSSSESTDRVTTEDEGVGPGQPCDVLGQDCIDDHKCVPDENLSHACAPIVGDKEMGEHCSVTWGVPAIDDCGADLFCWEGVCTPVCQGDSEDSAHCSEGLDCLLSGNFLGLCFGQVCDPLQPEPCPFDWACAPLALAPVGLAICHFAVDAAYGPEQIGDPCSSVLECIEGATCVAVSELPNCPSEYCCTAWCSPDEMSSCDGQPGTSCVSNPFDDSYGYCRVP
jgi:hypothetical protein